MKAAIYSKRSSGKVLEVVEIEPPVPKPDEVLIGVRAASVNPLDWRLKSHRPGVDVAGEVTSVGSGVTQFKPGDTTFVLSRSTLT
jgi:NADPH:quinone reductase-like Zn-dependent oxidoreductase